MNHKVNIVIVDDNNNFVSRMKSLLEELDFRPAIRAAGNYDDAVQLLQEKYQIIYYWI